MNLIFDFIREILATPLGFILSLFYDLTHNYIGAIVLLTLLVKLCFLPSSIAQHKTAYEQKKLNTTIALLRAKYANDPKTLKRKTEEARDNGPAPNKGLGCITSILLFAVMIGVLGVIYTPLTNVLHVEEEAVSQMQVIMADAIEESGQSSNQVEIVLLKETENYKEELLAENILTMDQINEIISFKEKYNFFGIDLVTKPQIKQFDIMWVIPIMVLIANLLTPVYSFIKRKKQNPNAPKFAPIEALPFITPLMVFLFAFMFSAGLGLYWAISSTLSFVQTVILGTIFDTRKIRITLPEDPEETVENTVEDTAEDVQEDTQLKAEDITTANKEEPVSRLVEKQAPENSAMPQPG